MTRIRAKANGNIVDVPEPRAGKLVRAGIFEYVEAPAAPQAPAAPEPAPEPVVSVEAQQEPENEPQDLSEKTRRELEELAEGLEIEGTGTNGYVTKVDLVRALSGRYGRRDLRAED